jgi:regulator of RNase E activity RraA
MTRETPVDDQIEQISQHSTSALSDALDRLAIPGQCASIMPLDRSMRLAGRAWTLQYGPIGQHPGTVGDYIDDLGPGQVVVLDNGGRLDATVWGDLLTSTAHRRQVAGTVIDGVCRDADRALQLGYPVFSRGNWMRTGKDRVCVTAVGGPVCVGRVRVEVGDLVRGDADGVVVIPAARAAEVLDAAAEIEAAEAGIRDAVYSGTALRAARAAEGYHQLQRRHPR